MATGTDSKTGNAQWLNINYGYSDFKRICANARVPSFLTSSHRTEDTRLLVLRFGVFIAFVPVLLFSQFVFGAFVDGDE